MGVTLSYSGLGGKVKFSGTSGKFKTAFVRPGLLDLYPNASGAYSLRKLSYAYTGSAIRVRRSSDNTETNIGFTSIGGIDTASLLTFCGAGNGFVTKWYDQSGNVRDLVQVTTNIQPKIVNSGTVYTTNSKPSVYLLGGKVDFPTGFLNGATNVSIQMVVNIDNGATDNIGLLGPQTTYNSGIEILSLSNFGNRTALRLNGTLRNNNSAEAYQLWNDNSQSLTEIYANTSSTSAYKNNSAVTLTDSSATPALNFNGVYDLGQYGGALAAANNGYIQEFVIYTSNQVASRSGIATNINSYYSIYTPPTPSSFDADAQAFFDRVTAAGGALTATEQTAVNTLTLSLKASGVWTKMRVIYPMVGASIPACSQNLKSSSYTGVFSGTWTYASTGVTPGGGASDIEVPLNLNVMNSINDISYGYYCRNDIALAGSFGWGVGGGILNEFWIKYGDNNKYGYLFDGANDGGAAGDSRGLNSISRIASNIKYIQKNATITAYSSVSSGTLSSRNFYFGRGSQGHETGRENAFGFVADGLTSINLSDLYNAVQAFQITLGRQI